MTVDDTVQQHEARITKLEVEVSDVEKKLGTICDDFKQFTGEGGAFQTMQTAVTKLTANGDTLIILIRYVVLPLIIIVGALVGVKIVWPGS